MKFFPDGTDTTFPRLFFLQSLLEESLKQIKFLPTGFIGTDIKSEELAFVLKDIGLEHLIEKIGVFGIEICCSDGVEYGLTLVKLVV